VETAVPIISPILTKQPLPEPLPTTSLEEKTDPKAQD
jgi:hypothetical protein